MKTARNYTAPYISSSLKDYMQGASLTLATCWRLVAKNGNTVAATSHTRDLDLTAYPSITFLSTQGVVPSAVDSEAGLTSAGLEVDGLFKVTVIDEESIAYGDWDAAYFEVFIINYEAPEMGELVMFAGYIGNVKTYGQRFRAEGRPLTSKATQEIGALFTPKCTVRNLGDNKCKVNLASPAGGDGAPITVTGTVTSGGSNIEFEDSSRTETTSYFDYGVIQFTSGILNGKLSEVRSYLGTTVTTVVRIPSNNTWKVSASNPAGWETAGYNDSGWSNAVMQGAMGALPWGTTPNFPTGLTSQWIWNQDTRNRSNIAGNMYFRKTFTPNVASGVLTIAVDNSYTVYLNGVSIGTGSNYQVSQTYALSLNIGVPNVIAIAAVNQTVPITVINPAGVLVDIKLAPYAPVGGGGTFRLQTPMSRIIPAGTTYTAIRGCDRTWQTCKGTYNNLINFRGFPFVPGIEKAYKINR